MVRLFSKVTISRKKRNNLPSTFDYVSILKPATEERPWGTFTVLDEGQNYKVKKFVVLPKHRLSLQYHNKRSENWTIVAGKALVTRDNEVFEVEAGQTVYIPLKAIHRIENIGLEPVIVIEVQYGSYVGEDDIVRLEDDYNRNT
ncbi:MAG: phosphomannose isomerase type II C-terminal cupin domain [Acidobacteria bacterium]|nr:phosphomannose isomerase type II C-terminal cupin domain [Acidobacteriota bacterium]